MYLDELKRRCDLLQRTIEKINKELPNFPEGNLRIQKKRSAPQYFHVTEKENPRGEYISVRNHELARELAEKTYYEKMLRESEKEYREITSFLKGISKISPEGIYVSMNDYRKELVVPLLITDAEYAKKWEEMPYQKNPYKQEECVHTTDKGDLVRSKSEARIADMYFALGIPYRYEAPLLLKNGKVKYPDFTLLKLPDRVEYYHEHMGCFEDELYRANNLKKLNEYAESRIFTGKNLILTIETDYAPLNIKEFRSNIREIFLTEDYYDGKKKTR